MSRLSHSAPSLYIARRKALAVWKLDLVRASSEVADSIRVSAHASPCRGHRVGHASADQGLLDVSRPIRSVSKPTALPVRSLATLPPEPITMHRHSSSSVWMAGCS
jgi:hypothetical protein